MQKWISMAVGFAVGSIFTVCVIVPWREEPIAKAPSRTIAGSAGVVAPATQLLIDNLKAESAHAMGHDPCRDTGLCGSPLPIHSSADVESVHFDAPAEVDDFRLLAGFHNLKEVRVPILSESQYKALRSAIPESAVVLTYTVDHHDMVIWSSYSNRHSAGTSE